MDIETILEMYEDDYNPSSTVPGPRNMADGERMEFGRGLKVLDKTEKKNVLNWGKNIGEGEWSSEKTLKEYNKASRDKRMKIRQGETTGEGIPGFKKKGDVRLLTKEQQKLWDATMANKVGRWEDYGSVNRGNWLRNIDQKLDKFSQTKNLLSREELGNFLTKKLGVEFDRFKIFGRRSGLISGEKKSKFGQYVDNKLFAIEFADGQQKYYKKPTDTQIKFIKENLLQNVQKNSLNTSTLNTIKKIDKLYGSIYKSGNLPDLKSMMKKLNLTGNQIAYAEAQLARIYGGHKFVNGPDIRVNNKTANSMFDIIAKSEFGNPRKNQVYEMSLELIDEGLGNEKGTFRDLKNKALQILKDNKIDVYDPKQGKKAFGFNIDELAGVTGSGKSKNVGVSQFINVMEGNLNTKELQSFQGGLSKARAAVEGAKGTPFYSKVLKEQMEKINTRALGLEKKHGIKLARLQKPADINNMTAKEVKRLKNINLGTGENLYQRLVKDAKASGYSVKMPKNTLTIQEFVDPKNKTQVKDILKKLEAHGCKGKAAGGRILFSNGSPDGAITTCAKKGVARFIDDLKSGNYSKATKDVLKGGGQFIKGVLNPMELLKLRNLIGPTAMGFMAAFEGGVITDDVIRQGTPLNESLANNWLTKSFLPYTKQYAQAKNLLESGTVPSNMKKYVQDVVTFNDMLMDMKGIEGRKDSRLVDDSFGMIDGTSMYTKEQEQKEDEALMKKAKTLTENVFTPGTAKALEMKSLQDEMEATRMAKKEFSPIFGFDKLKDVRTPGYTGFDYIPDEQPVDFKPITYKDYEKTELPAVERQYYENKLNIKPRSSLSEYSFPGSDINALEELTRRYNMREAAKYPGFFSADSEKFSKGGITTLRSKYEYKK